MRDKPYIVDAHILINVDQYQDPRDKDAKQHIRYLRHSVGRVEIREKKDINQQDDSGKEKRKNQKIEIHIIDQPPGIIPKNLLSLIILHAYKIEKTVFTSQRPTCLTSGRISRKTQYSFVSIKSLLFKCKRFPYSNEKRDVDGFEPGLDNKTFIWSDNAKGRLVGCTVAYFSGLSARL